MWGRHSCLPSWTRADRNVRATLGGICRWPSILSPPVDTCRHPSAVPAVPAVPGLENKDEDEDEDEKPPISSPVAFDKA
ncbi:MAG: hypothetical protein ACOYD3_03015 [Kiritimatiellia bacterium]